MNYVRLLNDYFILFANRSGTLVLYFAHHIVVHLQAFFGIYFGRANTAVVDLHGLHHEVAGFKIAQKKDSHGNVISETVVGYDASKHQVYIDRTHSGGKINPDNLRQTMDVADHNGKVKFEILLDNSSLEVFVNDGERVLTGYIYPGVNANGITVFSSDRGCQIKSLKIWNMSK